MELMTQEKTDQGKAAEAAGFCVRESSTSKNYDGLRRKMGSVLIHEPRVQAALLEVGGKELVSLALPAIRAMRKMVADPNAKGHRNAAESVLDRVGLGAEQKINVNHNVTDRTGAALVERIKELAEKHKGELAKMGIDAASFLGQQPMKVIEHEPREQSGIGEDQSDSPQPSVSVGAAGGPGGRSEADR